MRVVQVVAGPRTNSSEDGFALALTDQGSVYSWGKNIKGRLGHRDSDNVKAPKAIDKLVGKSIIQVRCVLLYCYNNLITVCLFD